MMLPLFDDYIDLSQKKVLVSLSAGINSAAVLCHLASIHPKHLRPKHIYIFYAHLKEHSPDSFRFTKDCIRYAQRNFECATWKIVRNSVIKYFRDEKFIPHPILSPCSEHLKWIPANQFKKEHQIDVDLIGFVKTERNRISRQQEKGATDKIYPISELSNEDCFELVDREIGWHPAIYDIRENGKRVFKHNNCLPCKNMTGALNSTGAKGQFESVAKYYPKYFKEAQDLAIELDGYWGRDADFNGQCNYCEFD